MGKAADPEQWGEHDLDNIDKLGDDDKRDFQWQFDPGFGSEV